MRTCDLYRVFDSSGQLLYVGISYLLENRLRQHAQNSGWFKSAAKFDALAFRTRRLALAAERKAITRESPLHNRHRPKKPKRALSAKQLEKLSVKRLSEFQDLIAACGMSQRQAAQALDRTQRMVEYWVSGTHEVPRTVLLAMRWLAEHPEAR